MEYDWNVFLTILFGAVGIASLLISGFAAWLSWQFYTEARGQSDRVSESVIRIESMVNSVQTQIQQIVEKTVSKFLEHSGMNVNSITEPEFVGKIAEISEQIEKILDDRQAGEGSDIKIELSEIIAREMYKIEEKLRRDSIRSIIPAAQRAVECRIDLLAQDSNYEEGVITIHVSRPVPVATASAKFASTFEAKPSLDVEMVSSSSHKPPTISSGVSHVGAFNIHLNASGGFVEPGIYKIKYRAAVSGS